MTREEVQLALTQLNQAIAQLDARLHPPPLDPGERAELNAEMAAAQQARASLEQTLNNLPLAAARPPMGLAEARNSLDRHKKAESDAAIRLSQAARQRSDVVMAMLSPPRPQPAPAAVTKPKKKRRAAVR